MWKRLKTFLSISFILFLSFKAEAQNVVYTFIDPCTKEVTNFSIPIQGGTVVYFYGRSASFTAQDVASGAFAAWVNQAYADYRKLTPCSVQSVTVTRNQITAQVIGNVVSSVVGQINSSVMQGSSMGGNDAASKGNNSSSEKKKNKNESSNSNTSNSTSVTNSNGNGSTSSSNNSSGQGNGSVPVGGGQTSGQGSQTGGNNSGGSGNNNTGGNGGGGGVSSNSNSGGSEKDKEKGSEVVATTVMNVEVRNDKGSESSGSSGGGKKGNGKSRNANPLIVSSDLTSAQNLDKSFTGIANIGMSRTSLMGTSSWGVTGMVWFNFKQFAINSRYTKIKMNQSGTLKFVHNVNLTGAYSYGNVFSFLGYSMIINAKKWGITGFNVSGAIAKLPSDSNLFISPSFTAFYTRPFSPNKKLTISPEIYLISTPVVYSSVDKITVTDRTFSAFLGSGFDYQISRRFKFNVNYKANLSTNPDFPILSFFLIGSKVNL